jgi:hypothetical protein
VQAVGFHIIDVVEAVDGAGRKTVGEEGHQCREEVVPFEQVTVEKQREEDE